jgi:hypothetical protein
MARSPQREIRPERLRCIDNGHVFIAQVPQLGHYVEDSNQPVLWAVDTTERRA